MSICCTFVYDVWYYYKSSCIFILIENGNVQSVSPSSVQSTSIIITLLLQMWSVHELHDLIWTIGLACFQLLMGQLQLKAALPFLPAACKKFIS